MIGGVIALGGGVLGSLPFPAVPTQAHRSRSFNRRRLRSAQLALRVLVPNDLVCGRTRTTLLFSPPSRRARESRQEVAADRLVRQPALFGRLHLHSVRLIALLLRQT